MGSFTVSHPTDSINSPAVAFSAGRPGTPEEAVAAPDGSYDYGEISPEVAAIIKRQPGKIILQQGIETDSEKYGLRHIASRHAEEIADAGYSIPEFVQEVTRSPLEIRKGLGGALVLVRPMPDKHDITRVAMVRLRPGDKGDYYRVETAFMGRSKSIDRKQPLLWEKSETIPEDSGHPPSLATAPSKDTGEGRPNGTPEQNNGMDESIDQAEDGGDTYYSLGLPPGGLQSRLANQIANWQEPTVHTFNALDLTVHTQLWKADKSPAFRRVFEASLREVSRQGKGKNPDCQPSA